MQLGLVRQVLHGAGMQLGLDRPPRLAQPAMDLGRSGPLSLVDQGPRSLTQPDQFLRRAIRTLQDPVGVAGELPDLPAELLRFQSTRAVSVLAHFRPTVR